MGLYGTRLQHTYTTEEEVTRIYSERGASEQVRDLADDSDFWDELIERASAKVNQYLAGLYEPAALKESVWIRDKATYIAAYFLSMRSGNPTLFQYQYEEALDELQQARDNLLYIGIPQSAGVRPLAYNVMHDNRFNVNPIRVIPASSSRTVPNQKLAFSTPFWWW